MSHELDRLMSMAAQGCWFIEPRKAHEIMGVLALRAANGPFAGDDGEAERMATVVEAASSGQTHPAGDRVVQVIPLYGTILPRAGMMAAMSGAAGLTKFQADFQAAATNPNVAAIIIDVDSPGGQIDLVPETAALIRKHRRADRPIVAVANTLAASAAYWIATAADELVVSPSGMVGSIGVYLVHQNMAARLEKEGIAPTFIYEGARKTEGNQFGPLDDVARAALQSEIAHYYKMFTSDVAKARGVPVSQVRADPETADDHFGGGRVYPASQAVKLGMADRVATLQETIARYARPQRQRRTNAAIERRRLALR